MIPKDLLEDYLIDVPIEIGTLSPVGERSRRWLKEPSDLVLESGNAV